MILRLDTVPNIMVYISQSHIVSPHFVQHTSIHNNYFGTDARVISVCGSWESYQCMWFPGSRCNGDLIVSPVINRLEAIS